MNGQCAKRIRYAVRCMGYGKTKAKKVYKKLKRHYIRHGFDQNKKSLIESHSVVLKRMHQIYGDAKNV